MRKNIKHFVGIDISKLKFDIVLINDQNKEYSQHQMFENSFKGVKRMLKWLVSMQVNLTETVFCMEHTGIYSQVVAEWLIQKSCMVWVEMPVVIIRSMGLQRGKNDKVDARKIALYAYKNREDIKSWVPPRKEIVQIKDLIVLRERLLKSMKSLSMPIGELKQMSQDKRSKYIKAHCRSSLTAFKKDIKNVELEIESIISSDNKLSKLYWLLISIPGIGKVTAWYLITVTNEFTLFKSAKQLACHVGVVPFDHQSGSSIHGKSRVSRMANKRLKTLLHLGALSLIKKDSEFKIYYDRKINEGKNKMLVINAIRNKMVHRVIAVVNRQTPYISEFKYAA